MEFYRITRPDGRLEFGTVGTEAAKRAKEIGGTSELIEVETNKKSLLAFFNELAGNAPAPSLAEGQTEVVNMEVVDTPIISTGKETHCPKCKFTPRQAEGYVATIKRGLTIDGMKQWIEEREGWELSTIVEAVTYRLGELVQTVTGKSKAA